MMSYLAVSVYQGVAAELEDIHQTALQMPVILRSYQFSFSLRDNPNSTTCQKVDVWQSGSNIKTNNIWILPEGEKFDPLISDTEYAFNGIDYQWFIAGHQALTFSKKCRHPTPYWTPSPLMYPYYWIAGQQTNWSDIKDRVKWDMRFKEARYVGQKNENNIHFEIVSFSFPQMNMDKVHVYFAKNLNYYPLKFWGYKAGYNNGSPVLEVQVTQFKTFDVNGMLFVFPLNVELHVGTNEEDSINMYWTVFESSIQINPQLDEDLFTISPSRAITVTDFDKELEKGVTPSFRVADDGRDIIVELPKAAWNLRWVIFVANNFILLSLLLYLFLRRKKR
ncbi:MAG: hypothetical protein LBG58_17165 [Planctomycetaceae bacterium]|nr:hypothetical protein [Planctomycetaceae bacterium]